MKMKIKIKTYLALACVTGRLDGSEVARCVVCAPITNDGRRALFERLFWRRSVADLQLSSWQIMHLRRSVRSQSVVPDRAVLCSEILRQALIERREWRMTALGYELIGRFERELDIMDDDLATIRV